MSDQLTRSEKFVLDWQYRHLGGFFSALIDVIKIADSRNRELLRRGFPDEVAGYESFAHTSGWWDEVQTKAKRLGWTIKI